MSRISDWEGDCLDAYQKGWDARDEGVILTQNPYQPLLLLNGYHLSPRNAWTEGWEDCHVTLQLKNPDTAEWICQSCNVALGGPCKLVTITDWIIPTCCPFGERGEDIYPKWRLKS